MPPPPIPTLIRPPNPSPVFTALVEANFADHVAPDKGIYRGAIQGMLRTLDPHSNFFDPEGV